MRNTKKLYDFKAFGQVIKSARENKGWTREVLAGKVNLAPRYIMSIENKGQHPSFQVFYELVTLFNISVDQFFFPDTGAEKSTRRRQLEKQLDELDDKDLIIIEATAKGIIKTKEAEK
ncbi:helix-turn-helix transcriptional regulator [Pelotomaculum terephthalicicum JT]|uniref:helix-turn-helix transcriptional regulator n=1 Tax=Pelotomaculum terephthalicicum TaxID=206393 RepID=UPI001F04D74E|nr:helix-turn-helix transcriptional regulator [Pelotomaculum terephthalicicum]MCG9968368.1 helix-turn-helix transcriptional regulator [Pelotomaculum terephthalicicum JT]